MASTDIFNSKVPIPEWGARFRRFDQGFSAKVMGGDRVRMTIKELEYGAAQIAIILAIAACGLVEGGSKKIEPTKDLSNPTSPLSFYVSESNANGNPGLIRQLNLIKSQARPTFGSCVPYLIHQEEGDKSINIGICAKDKDKNNKAKVLVVDYIKPNSPTVLVNKETVMRREGNDIVLSYLDDQGNRVDLVTFPDKSTNFQLFSGWGVQVAAAAEIDTPTPTSTATLVPATPAKLPTETPTLVNVDHMPANLSPDQQATWNLAPDLTGSDLTKSAFLVDKQSNFLMYTDASGHVTKVYDAEGARTDNALQVGPNNFILNEGPASIIINPKRTYDSASTAISQAVDYFRLKLCANAKNKSLPAGDLSDILKSDFATSLQSSPCDVTLKPTSEVYGGKYSEWDFAVGQQKLKISADTPMVFRIVDKPNKDMINKVGIGASIKQATDGVIIIDIYNKSSLLPPAYSDFDLAFRLNFSMDLLLARVKNANVFYVGSRDPILQNILYNPYTFKPASPVIFTK